jgi:SAM-dependent methyltransferase
VPDAPLHPLIEGLRTATGVYDRGRPGYPPVLVDALLEGAGAGPGARVADLGAGTGQLAGPLLERGVDVLAVEPLAEMRTALAGLLGPERVLDGTAEALPFADRSLDAILCADSFHWFGPGAAAELHRVLRPGAALAISWRWPPEDGAPWVAPMHALLAQVRPPHPAFETADRGRDRLDAHGGFTPQEHREVRWESSWDSARLCEYVASITYVAALEPARRERLLADVAALVADEPSPLRVPWAAECWFTRRRP